MSSPPLILGDDFLALLHRHFINLMCLDSGAEARLKNKGKPAFYNFSAFIVEINSRWFAITAGHIFDTLKKAQANGANISRWHIDDSIVSSKPEHPYPITIDIDRDVIWFSDNVPGVDYACFELGELTRQALLGQGIQAISSEVWAANDISEYSLWLLVGTPKCLVNFDFDRPTVKHHATIRLERVNSIPTGFTHTEYQRLYACLDFSSIKGIGNSFDIDGMSGGPIFGLKPSTSSNQYEYRIIGVQSSCTADHVAICAAAPFIEAIAQCVGNGAR
ncbi:MAG: Uncharacterized protein AWT59_0723 [Candidatus Gallionella acididurans]|uniref:Uncharacterized protein n=1 Tax=Candidatus Gallionella acididurans TaxID=1796491 RepID=A0A139BW00_9PROT|nr:MAG: Uncharacterized protein AWT59_0723 [Candidatus Gallionella acididurans]